MLHAIQVLLGPVGCLKVCHGWYGRPALCCLYVTFGYPRLECLKEWCWLLEVMPCIFRGQFICLTSSSVMKAICRIALRRSDLCWCATFSETASCNPHAAHMTKVLRSRRCLKALGCPEENWTKYGRMVRMKLKHSLRCFPCEILCYILQYEDA